jgi:hypothetical protein
MLITPITLNHDYKRYMKLDETKVLDTITNQVYDTENSDVLINKLEIIGRVNNDTITNKGTGKLLDVNV